MNKRSGNIEESRKKLTKEIGRIRELDQKLADTRFKIASIKKRTNIKERTLPIKRAGISRTHEADPDEVRLEHLMSSEAELSEALGSATKNVEALVQDFATFDISESTRLLSSDLPILLFPIRLETKFDVDSEGIKQLLVRIYPDKIAVQTHEDRLTEDEIESGKLYWKTIWYKGRSNKDARKKAWGALTFRYGAARADCSQFGRTSRK
jgi:hypothetical protein